MVNRDLFDELTDIDFLPNSPEGEDPFSGVVSTEEMAIEKMRSFIDRLASDLEVKEKKNRQSIAEIRDLIRSEIAKIKPVQNVIERQIEQIERRVEVPIKMPPPMPPPPQIIVDRPHIVRETTVEVRTEKQDISHLAHKKEVEALEKKIEKLQKDLELTRETMSMVGGSGTIGLPVPDRQEGKFLKVVKNQWVPASGSGAITGYTVTNGNTLKSFDVTDTSLDEVARILGSLLTDLQA